MPVEGCKGLPVFGSVPYRTRVKFGRTRVRQVHFDTLKLWYSTRTIPAKCPTLPNRPVER